MFNERAGVFYELRVYWTVSKTFDVDLLILALIFLSGVILVEKIGCKV